MWASGLAIALVGTAVVVSSLTFTDISTAAVSPAATLRVSVDTGGRQSTEDNSQPAMSADGRYVAFTTGEAFDPVDKLNWSPPPADDDPDTNEDDETGPDLDVYVRDTVRNTTTLISHGRFPDSTTRVPSNGESSQPAISADGRYVAFHTNASNIGGPSAAGAARTKIVVCDRDSDNDGTLSELCDFTRASAETEFDPTNPHLSAGAQLISYDVPPADIIGLLPATTVPDDDHGWISIASLRRDADGTLLPPTADDRRTIGAPVRHEVGDVEYGLNKNSDSFLATGGTHLAFVAQYVRTDGLGQPIYLVYDYDIGSGQLTRMDVEADGSLLDGTRAFTGPALSADGRRLAFVDRRDDARTVVRLYDRDPDGDGTFYQEPGDPLRAEIGSRTTDGTDALGTQPAFSADGRYLAFTTPSANMHNGVDDVDKTGSCLGRPKTPTVILSWCDVVVRDLVVDRQREEAGQERLPAELVTPSVLTACATHTPDTTCEGTGDSGLMKGLRDVFDIDGAPVLSADGSAVAYASAAPDLISDPSDTNGKVDVFQRRFRPTLTGEPQDFGQVPLGAEAVRDVPLTHSGAGPLSVTAITVEGANPGDFDVFPGENCSTVVLHAGEKCTVSLRFRPTVLGARTATLHVTLSRGGAPLDLALTGVGVPAPVSGFAASPALLDFGARGVLRVSPTKTVTVTNPGTAPLQVLTVKLNAVTASTFPVDYQIMSDTCGGRSVPPGGSCRIIVRHRPKAVGKRPGFLRIAYVGTATLTHSVKLLGEGTPPTLTSSPQVSPAGRVIQLTGANYPPGSTVTLDLVGMPSTVTAKVGADGGFEVPFVLMPNTYTGNHPLNGVVDPASAPAVVGPLAATLDFLVVPGSPVPPDFDIRR
jgi:Tol biopolymer transport system component